MNPMRHRHHLATALLARYQLQHVLLMPLQVLTRLMSRIQDQCSHLIRASLTAQSGLQAFDFLGNSVLAAVDQQVADALPGELKKHSKLCPSLNRGNLPAKLPAISASTLASSNELVSKHRFQLTWPTSLAVYNCLVETTAKRLASSELLGILAEMRKRMSDCIAPPALHAFSS